MTEKGYAEQPLGGRFGKHDLERLGYFDDPSPAPFDRYEGPVKFREGIEKGRQIIPGPPNPFFEPKFVRIFDGEALYELYHIEAQERLNRERRIIGGRMLPPSPSKKHSTPGDWHGCFEKITHFSPEVKAKPKAEPELPNPKIKPNPRGGPGYANICLSPYPTYSHELYDRPRKDKIVHEARFLCASAPLDFFPPNPHHQETLGPTYIRPAEEKPKLVGPSGFYIPFPKKPGGNHSGGFHKYPTYSSSPYEDGIKKTTPEGKFFSGGPPKRTKFTESIINHVTNVSCNSKNYFKYREQVYKLDK